MYDVSFLIFCDVFFVVGKVVYDLFGLEFDIFGVGRVFLEVGWISKFSFVN